MDYRIASYNIENMRRMFKRNRFIDSELARGEASASTLAAVAPHIAGIIEASEKRGDHQHFLDNSALAQFNFKIAQSSHKRGKQDLILYYRDPFEVVSIDDHYEFYTDWLEDIDGDTIKEQLHFERKPLEVRFRDTTTGKEFLVILVSLKSKGVFSITDIHLYEHIALANRKKQFGQAKKIRSRLEQIMTEEPDLPFIVMGDVNDEPGLDYFQRIVGAGTVETLMGDLFHPEQILHNALYHFKQTGREKELWTTEFPDRIVANFQFHRAWLDHIFVSPSMMKPNTPVKLVPESGDIGEKTDLAKSASDHFPVFCDLEL